jgi:hypothetical protein
MRPDEAGRRSDDAPDCSPGFDCALRAALPREGQSAGLGGGTVSEYEIELVLEATPPRGRRSK